MTVGGLATIDAASAGVAHAAGVLTWTLAPGSPDSQGVYNAVNCTDATDCTAVGYEFSDGSIQPSYATESGGVWGSVTEVSGASGDDNEFNGVSCTDTTDCTAVGIDNSDRQPIYASESGGVWGSATEVSVPGDHGGFEAVSCSDAANCTAVGYDDNGPSYATESGGVWGTTTAISDAGSGGFFTGVSCIDSTDCTAVGLDGTDGPAMYATESGGVWGSATEVAGAGSFFAGVSCSDATDCTAVGGDANGQPIYATESGGVWGSPTEVSVPSLGGGDFYGVSCIDAADCTAVGGYDNSQPIYATESGGVWDSATEVPGTDANDGQFWSVSCSDATDCTAVDNKSIYVEVIATATVTFNSEGGSAVADVSGPVGSTVTLPAGPSYPGYSFNGWFTAPTGGSALTSPYTLSASVTLYAQWTAPQATTVSGTVTDPDGNAFGSPIVAGAAACPSDETFSPSCPGGAVAIADPSGSYSLTLAPGSYVVLGFSLAPGNPTPAVSAAVTLTLGPGQALTQDFTVPYPATTVSGTVTDPDGNAFASPIVAGAAACPSDETFSPSCPGGAVAIADPSGSYSMTLTPGSYVVVGFSLAPGNPTPGVSAAVILTLSAGETVTQDFTVPYPATSVSGTVTDAIGSPFPSPTLSGALACPTGEGVSPSCPGGAVALADPSGFYSMTLAPGSYVVLGFSLAPANPTPAVSAAVTLTLSPGDVATQNFAVPDPTTLTYTGPTQGALGDPALVSATLTDDVSDGPIAGQVVSFGIGSVSCSATTNSSGSAACILIPAGPSGSSSLTAGFTGNGLYAASSATTSFNVLGATCSLCVLSPSASPALSLTGNGTISVPGGSIAVNSTGKQAASLTGNGTVTATQIGGPGAPAGFKVTGNGKFSPAPVTESAVGDPLAPLPECPGAGTPSPCPTNSVANVSLTGNGAATISPGIYQSISVTGNGKLTFNPGTYVITGSLSLTGNGSIKGSGVAIYFACSAYPAPCTAGQSGASFSLAGNGTVDLTAPTSGMFQGISIFVDRNDTATDTLTGNGSTIGGTIYATSAKLTLTGNGSMVIGRLIVSTLTLTGNGSVTIG